jgi:hypothetical protein
LRFLTIQVVTGQSFRILSQRKRWSNSQMLLIPPNVQAANPANAKAPSDARKNLTPRQDHGSPCHRLSRIDLPPPYLGVRFFVIRD